MGMREISIRGNQIPALLLAMLVILTGAGAAAGVAFDGNVEGESVSKVDQSLTVQTVDVTGDTNNDIGKTSDDNTSFRTAANLNQGDSYNIELNVHNKASQNVTGQLTLDIPEPLEVEVSGQNGLGVARTSMSTWNFEIADDEDPQNEVIITVASPDDIEPGFYDIKGEIHPTEA